MIRSFLKGGIFHKTPQLHENALISKDLDIVNKWYVDTKVDTKLPLTGGTMMGAIIGIQEKAVILTDNNIDLLKGNVFIKTITGPTAFTISNVATTANTTNSFILELTNAGSYSVGFWSAIKWHNGNIPTFTAAGTDVIGFYSTNNGVTWRGIFLSKDSK